MVQSNRCHWQCRLQHQVQVSSRLYCREIQLEANQASGSLSTMTAADIPQDLHDVFTHRLPDEVYFYLSRGLLSPHALIWLTSGT
jgi:hypothetical protein